MTLESAPAGTVVVVGHPANGHTATKQECGVWRSNVTHKILELDPRDVTSVAYAPPS